MTPSALLKKLVMGSNSMQSYSRDQSIVDSVQFMSERLNSLSQSELASRLTLNCVNCYVEPQRLHNLDITIMDVSLSLFIQIFHNLLSESSAKTTRDKNLVQIFKNRLL